MPAEPSSTKTLSKPSALNATFLRPNEIAYPPPGTLSRAQWKLKSGKDISKHRWQVYDHVLRIPEGMVTTYKHVATALGSGSARSVGAALVDNPFAPYVPCHRVIASDLSIGGFFGEWNRGRKAGRNLGLNCERKRRLLANEGVHFDEKGYLLKLDQLWFGSATNKGSSE
ncbi:hypothetical protein FRC03_009725 [Tulasnella sp. 419]|nr:hypothetical protein FRC03_009725 [Tulasnella sp. 419]